MSNVILSKDQLTLDIFFVSFCLKARRNAVSFNVDCLTWRCKAVCFKVDCLTWREYKWNIWINCWKQVVCADFQYLHVDYGGLWTAAKRTIFIKNSKQISHILSLNASTSCGYWILHSVLVVKVIKFHNYWRTPKECVFYWALRILY